MTKIRCYGRIIIMIIIMMKFNLGYTVGLYYLKYIAVEGRISNRHLF